jgi:hypothetical protein
MFVVGVFNALEKFYGCSVGGRWSSYYTLLEVSSAVFKSRWFFKSEVLLGRTLSSVPDQLPVVAKGSLSLGVES